MGNDNGELATELKDMVNNMMSGDSAVGINANASSRSSNEPFDSLVFFKLSDTKKMAWLIDCHSVRSADGKLQRTKASELFEKGKTFTKKNLQEGDFCWCFLVSTAVEETGIVSAIIDGACYGVTVG